MTQGSRIFWLLARVFTGGIFAYGGLMKLLEPRANFELVLQGYGLFPEPFLAVIAAVLPWMEWLGGMFLVVGYAPRMAASLLLMLTLGFLSSLLAGPLLRGTGGANCGCFGTGLQLSHREVFLLDLLNLLVLATMVWRGSFLLSFDEWFFRRRAMGEGTK